jgi:RimJ/RimL family protein N-acetyltransferase
MTSEIESPGIAETSVAKSPAHVRLRAICRADLERLRGFVNDPDVMQFSNVYRPISDSQQDAWFEGICRDKDSVWYAIDVERAGETRLIGTCCLLGFDWPSRLAELRVRIGDRSAWGQGFGREAVALLLSYGFKDLGLERIWLRVYSGNQRALRLYRRLGFREEGTLRQAAVVAGNREDVVLMGLLRSEWAHT